MPYTDSEPATAGIRVMGILIHDPLDPAGTVHGYPLGADSKDTAIDVEQTGTQYAGRTFPVIDYGEGETQIENIGLTIPSGPSYFAELESLKTWARLRRAVHYRDNRGRSIRGTMSGLKIADQPYGADVKFTLTRVNVSGETVSA